MRSLTQSLCWLLAFCCLPPALAADANQQRLLFGHDDRQKVDPATAPWNAIAQIETETGQVCSGLLIDPHWVITAGHCFVDQDMSLQAATSLTLAGRPHTTFTPDRVFYSQALVDGLQPDGDSFIIAPEASPQDIALVHVKEAMTGIDPIPMWQGTLNALGEALKQAPNQVTQAGYPQDHLDTLFAHQGCEIRAITPEGLLEHRCETLPGDSGSPLLLHSQNGWVLIGVQSSAPNPADRDKADNLALAIPHVAPLLKRWMQSYR